MACISYHDGRALRDEPGLQYPISMVECTHLITTVGTSQLHNRGSSMQVNSFHSSANDM